MTRALILTILTGTMILPAGLSLAETEALEDAIEADDCLPTGLQPGLGSGLRKQPNPLLPGYLVCDDFAGGCLATEQVGFTAEARGWNLIIYASVKADLKIHVSTTIECSGSLDLAVLSWDGVGLRSVSSTIGDPSAPQPPPAALAAQGLEGLAPFAASQSSVCEYIGQITECATHHTTGWALANRTINGRIISPNAKITVCAPVEILNHSGAIVPRSTPVAGSLVNADYVWQTAACGQVDLTVAQAF